MVANAYELTTITRDGIALALHHWRAAAPRAVVCYVHGTQSHAGWMFETGPALAAHGCTVYALDRRGSGASSGRRGDVESHRQWCDDYLGVLADVRARHRELPLLLVGQSFGGAIAAGVAYDPRAEHDALLLVAPLLVPKPGPPWQGRPEGEPIAVTVPDDWYTSDPRYLAFMASDSLMVRALTPRFHRARAELAEATLARGAPLADRPCALILPRRDRIVDLVRAREVFDQLAGGRGIVIELPTEDHFIEFSPCRSILWHLEAAFAETRGFRGASAAMP